MWQELDYKVSVLHVYSRDVVKAKILRSRGKTKALSLKANAKACTFKAKAIGLRPRPYMHMARTKIKIRNTCTCFLVFFSSRKCTSSHCSVNYIG